MSIEPEVARHYGQDGLHQRITAALRVAGKNPEQLDPDDLGPVDEFHHGGRDATVAFAPRLGLQPGMRLLDIGSGIGGPARYFARHHGCVVTGIDLTEEFVEVAGALTAQLGLADRVRFHHGSALAMPFEDASFDAATLLHVGMNIDDKPRLFAEVRRVLKPGGVFGVFDQMRENEGDLTFPVPWASVPDTSFVETAATYKALLQAAGFIIEWERSLRDEAIASFNKQTGGQAGGVAPPPLGVHVMMGPSAGQKIANHRGNTERGLVAPNEIVARRA